MSSVETAGERHAPLDADLRAFLLRAEHVLGPAGADLARRRERYLRLAELAGQPAAPSVARTDMRIPAVQPGAPEVALRLYEASAGRRDAVAVYLHGGGWSAGSIASHDGLCAWMAERTGLRIASIEYRLSPEHPHPAALHDAQAAVCWAHAAHGHVALVGDSAGGYLAAAGALWAVRQHSLPLAWLGMLYPAVSPCLRLASHDEHAESIGLKLDMLRQYWCWFAGEGSASAQAPLDLLEVKHWQGLPPTHIVAAPWDPLRDEARALARRMADSGVAVSCHEAQGMAHGFARFVQQSPRAHRHMRDFCAVLRQAMGGP